MSDKSEDTPALGTATGIVYVENPNAPFVYFDGVSCHGALNGILEIELVARVLAPVVDGTVSTTFGPVARLRCTPTAAAMLIDSVQKATQMAAQSQQQASVAATKLN